MFPVAAGDQVETPAAEEINSLGRGLSCITCKVSSNSTIP